MLRVLSVATKVDADAILVGFYPRVVTWAPKIVALRSNTLLRGARSADGSLQDDVLPADLLIMTAPLATGRVLLDELAASRELDRVLDEGLLRSVYQPITDLDSGALVGYEALARGPHGSALERPDRLFAAADVAGRTLELEWACRAAALTGALSGGLQRPLSLFINVEPSTLQAEIPRAAVKLLEAARSRFRVVIELTERGLTERPAEVLSSLRRLRALDCAIALDDVGTDPRSLALMPFVRPEVIKLDMRLVQSRMTPALADVVNAVNAEAEREDVRVLAEGIETPAHAAGARALGATLGQGWLLGRPAPLGDNPREHAEVRLPPRDPLGPAPPTPYEIVSAWQRPRRGDKRLLYAISRQLEARIEGSSDAAVVLVTFQDERFITHATAARYQKLAARAAFVGALGLGLSPEPVPGVRGATLTAGEALAGEWSVIVLDPHFAAAFTARDLGDTGPDWERQFDFCLTYDRERVTAAARTLMERIAPR
jgi:EAL domain-containing protein (putative c-di-GMP-specific phosphodiesterase class I)